mmetsp:Transcript_72808/g.201853  ORF Transcript_72808/g.201853 Transcript_72808/m.201853 type:complete len:109 (-) Transcript_72808:160-486(-)|eukprot:CAMPEP_0117557678 /NCGR_PEP_ID=MMETSP0784-20121206/52448_1 /TAXON_ID=39447 /ORGANISM="" /LENGTH=108 /DNA_ID=CAMNT_0005354991 /DNA_START=77 /DNA_END=403 /DNA_ORIENTATION=+
MGRSAKIVRMPAFEKQKRAEKGQEWKKSQWKEARQQEKTKKKQERQAVAVAGSIAADKAAGPPATALAAAGGKAASCAAPPPCKDIEMSDASGAKAPVVNAKKNQTKG